MPIGQQVSFASSRSAEQPASTPQADASQLAGYQLTPALASFSASPPPTTAPHVAASCPSYHTLTEHALRPAPGNFEQIYQVGDALMPTASRYNTWNVVFTNLYQYRSSQEFQDYSLSKKNKDTISPGICVGASYKWCDRYLGHPDEVPLERLNYLENDPMALAATQFLHEETFDYMKGPLGDAHRFGEYLESLARVSRLKFDFAFGVHFPESMGSLTQFMSMLKSNSIYCFRMYGHQTIFPFVDAGHMTALAIKNDSSANFFDPSCGEFEIDQNRLQQFFREYWPLRNAAGDTFYMLAAYEVSRMTEQRIVQNPDLTPRPF